jgi:heme ABC exporter ATP-binding subunit CcmA
VTAASTLDFDQLSLQSVSRHFGRRRALRDVTLTCSAGEIVGLLGPNGAGKSTLLAIVSTLLAPSAGSVRYGQVSAQESGPSVRARIGLLAHEVHLYPELSAKENLGFFARLYGVDDVDRKVAAALGRAGLTGRADEPVSSFSRGLRQRVALERALIHHPRLLLLDEPFTGLDDASGRMLIARLKDLRGGGCIILLATHDLDLAEGLFDRIAVLRDGRLEVAAAPPAGLRERYREVAARLG